MRSTELCVAKHLTKSVARVSFFAMSAQQSLAGRAEDNLAFVRDVLARSEHFSAIPGWGGIAMGASALVAALVAAMSSSRTVWLGVWLSCAAVAAPIGAVALIRKARRAALPLTASPARRFAMGLMPPICVGGMLTIGARRIDAWSMLAPIWLSCYGIGVLGAGAVSTVRAVPILGACFVVLAGLALATPFSWATAWLALGFGAAHIAAGIFIVRKHGG